MAKESYSLKNVSIAYAPNGGAAFDCKNGLSTDGCTIAMAEDFGERTMGADGSTLWSEYMTANGTVTLSVMANSPAYAFFVTLQNAQRTAGGKGRDTMTIVNRDFSEQFACASCAIQNISGEKYDKTGNAVRTITINAGSISRIAA